jgi:hypothetical protein
MKNTRQPWEHRRWRGGICTSDLATKSVAYWAMTAMLGGIIALLMRTAPELFNFDGNRWLLLVPAGIGSGMLIFAANALVNTARWARFGKCFIRMHTAPGEIGGHFRGEAVLPDTSPMDSEVLLQLKCESMSRIYGRNDNSDTTYRDTEWEDSIQVATGGCSRRNRRCTVPFDFEIPAGLPDETDSRRDSKSSLDYDWRLRVTTELKGPDLNMEFVVPIFKNVQLI